MSVSLPARVFDPERLAAVRATGLLDTAAEAPFERLASLASTLLDAPLAFITIADDTRSFWKSCIGVDATAPGDREIPLEESFCQYVVGSQEPLIVGDVTKDPRTRVNPSIERMGVRAWAGFPLVAPTGEVLGTFCVVDRRIREWSERDVEVLRTLSLAAAGELALRAALRKAGEETQRAADETLRAAALARTLQETLLPPTLPRVPGLEIATRYTPAGSGAEVLGDFYDVFETGGRWSVVIGDVCGKGVPAAKVTALARYTIRAAAMREARPSAVLAQLNEALLEQPYEVQSFLTATLLEVRSDDDGVAVVLCSAGHWPALVRRADGTVETLGETGMLMGVLPLVTLTDQKLRLAPGDRLVLYTDGVIEARRNGELFGEDRLRALVTATDGSPAALAAAVEEAVISWTPGFPTDDIAVLVLAAAPRRA